MRAMSSVEMKILSILDNKRKLDMMAMSSVSSTLDNKRNPH